MSIDWQATGSMLQGWATLAGAAAVIYAAFAGKSTFGDWRRQKQEERRMDAAEKILDLAYRLRDDFEAIRSPLMLTSEVVSATRRGEEEIEDWREQGAEFKRRFRVAGPIIARLEQHKSEFQEVWRLKPLARAYFGEDVAGLLQEYWRIMNAVSFAAQSFLQDHSDKVLDKENRRTFSSAGKPNPTTDEIEAATSGLEKILVPIIRTQAER